MLTDNQKASLEKKFCVYKHTLKNDGRMYIGITCQKPENRWGVNGEGYKSGGYHNRFYNAIKKYGWENFEHEILFDGLSCDDAKRIEIELIAKYRTTGKMFGFNTQRGGDLGSFGLRQSPESIEKRRIKNTGKKRSEETKKRMSEAHQKQSQETIDRIRKALVGRKRSDNDKQRISEATRIALQRPEVREKMREAAKRRKPLPERRVYCIDTDRYYKDRFVACEILGLDLKILTDCLKRKRKYCNGYRWVYVKD